MNIKMFCKIMQGAGIVLFTLTTTARSTSPLVQNLWQGEPPLTDSVKQVDTPTLTICLPESDQGNGAAVVILPGGGYWNLAMQHEGHQVANWLNSFGVAGIIVKYRRGPGAKHPVPLLDAQRAIRTVRYKADEWGLDPDRIGVLGFSAGGHLASSTGVHFDDGDLQAADPVEAVSSRPDFMILVYPVISMQEEYTHQGSKRNLLGEHPPAELVQKMSTETQITKKTPPTFLLLTNEDQVVPAENGIAFYLALRRAGVPSELHVFEDGEHGFGLAPYRPILSQWKNLCEQWMEQRGYLEFR